MDAIDHLAYANGVLSVHLAAISGRATKTFTHGRVTFDADARMATFGTLPSVALPLNLTLSDGAEIQMQLVGPDGALRTQTRRVVFRRSPARPGLYSMPGMAKSPRRFTADEGWTIERFRYRAYFSHPGLNTDPQTPQWLNAAISRQKALWNRLAWLCREARRKCSSVPAAEVRSFAQAVVLPAIDAFNGSLGRSKDKMRHPKFLRSEEPGIEDVWGFAGQLRKRIVEGRRVPEGLLESCVTFAQQFPADYGPLNEFLVSFRFTAKRAAAELGLVWYEREPVIRVFQAVIKARRTVKASFSEGWPVIKYTDSPGSEDWGLEYPMKTPDTAAEDLDFGSGIPGLRFGPALPPSSTGHPDLVGNASSRRLREAWTSIRGENRENLVFRFGVLQHRPLPAGSHIKGWKLIYKDHSLWLCLTIERQRLRPAGGNAAAGLDIGWRRTDSGIRFGTLYEPAAQTFQDLTMDLRTSPGDQSARSPFRIDLGPTRWERRNFGRLLPEWKGEDPVPDTLGFRGALQSHIAFRRQQLKTLLKNHLGERFPSWVERAGRRGLLKIADEFRDDPFVVQAIADWNKEDERYQSSYSLLCRRTTRRIEDGHSEVAHDVCRLLKSRGITQLVVETSFLARVSQRAKSHDSESLARSQKYRQFVSAGKFVATLRHIALKYAIAVQEMDAANTTRICQYCNHLNASTEREAFQCGSCGRLLKQDQNGAVNLSRFFGNPELAAAAQFAGKFWKA